MPALGRWRYLKFALATAFACWVTAEAGAAAVVRPTVGLLKAHGTILVWVRDLEQSGLTRATFDARTQTLTLARGNVRLAMRIGSQTAYLNALPVRVPAPARIIGGRGMVPARFALDALGLHDVVVAGEPPRRARAEERDTAAQGQAVIQGRALYAGRPQPGVVLRLVRADDFTFLPGLRARTDKNGRYRFSEVPDGAYRVYAYVGDNPGYFNRATATIQVAGRPVEAQDINLGRMLEAVDPPSGATLSGARDMVFTWSPCPQATRYHLSVVDPATNEEVFSAEVATPYAAVDLSRMSAGCDYEWRVTATDASGAFLGGSPGSGVEPWRFGLAVE